MSTPILNRIFYQKYKLYCPMKIISNSASNTLKSNSKKKFTIKNKFTYHDELHQLNDTVYSESRILSPGKLPEQYKNEEYDDLHVPHSRIISSDLLSREKESRQRKNQFSQVKKSKPLLTYQGEILFGVHPIYLALLQKKRTFHHLFTREDIDFASEGNDSTKSKIIRLAKSMNVPVSYIDARGLKILAPGVVHQGICLDAEFLPLPDWNEYEFKNDDACEVNPLWLVLDEILDPMNVGAIIRSAFYFGVNKLFTVKGNSCKFSPIVSKASSGSLEVMNIYQIDNLVDFIKGRKDKGWSIVSTIAYIENKSEFCESSITASDYSISKPTILILGNEGRGISQDVLKLCDFLISIEPGKTLPEGIDSLNVSVAAGVLLYVLNSKNVKR